MERRRAKNGESYCTYSAEEERELIAAWRAGDHQAGAKLVASAHHFIVAMARRYLNMGLELEDLIAQGNLGLVDALREGRWDAARGRRFMTYAVAWVKLYMLRASLAHQEFSGKGKRLFFQTSRELAIRLRMNGQSVEEAYREVAAKYGVGVDEIVVRRNLSLYETIGHSGSPLNPVSLERIDLIKSPDLTPEELAILQDERLEMAVVRGIYDQAARTPRDRLILERRLLADPDDKLSLEEIGEQIGVTRERVRQLEVDLKERIRQLVEARREALRASEARWDRAPARVRQPRC